MVDRERSEQEADGESPIDPALFGAPRSGSPFDPTRLGTMMGGTRPAGRFFGRNKTEESAELATPSVEPARPTKPAEPAAAPGSDELTVPSVPTSPTSSAAVEDEFGDEPPHVAALDQEMSEAEVPAANIHSGETLTEPGETTNDFGTEPPRRIDQSETAHDEPAPTIMYRPASAAPSIENPADEPELQPGPAAEFEIALPADEESATADRLDGDIDLESDIDLGSDLKVESDLEVEADLDVESDLDYNDVPSHSDSDVEAAELEGTVVSEIGSIEAVDEIAVADDAAEVSTENAGDDEGKRESSAIVTAGGSDSWSAAAGQDGPDVVVGAESRFENGAGLFEPVEPVEPVDTAEGEPEAAELEILAEPAGHSEIDADAELTGDTAVISEAELTHDVAPALIDDDESRHAEDEVFEEPLAVTSFASMPVLGPAPLEGSDDQTVVPEAFDSHDSIDDEVEQDDSAETSFVSADEVIEIEIEIENQATEKGEVEVAARAEDDGDELLTVTPPGFAADTALDAEEDQPIDQAEDDRIDLVEDEEDEGLPSMEDLRTMAAELDEVDAILERLDTDPEGLAAELEASMTVEVQTLDLTPAE